MTYLVYIYDDGKRPEILRASGEQKNISDKSAYIMDAIAGLQGELNLLRYEQMHAETDTNEQKTTQ